LPPPSRPQDDELDATPAHRPGIPYPEWNAWTNSFLRDHVAVLGIPAATAHPPGDPASADLRAVHPERRAAVEQQRGGDVPATRQQLAEHPRLHGLPRGEVDAV
ncbi:hypothetical protein H7H37_21825, partial [Mycolicibacterium insubricum]|nr:hypothetical protein [Mycolicibacterium insubricum]